MVTQKLREAIMSGTLKRASGWFERELCEMTGVSRPRSASGRCWLAGAVGLQPTAIADRWPADAGHLAEFAFDQPLARLQRSRHDGSRNFCVTIERTVGNVVDPKRGLQFSASVPWSMAFVPSFATPASRNNCCLSRIDRE